MKTNEKSIRSISKRLVMFAAVVSALLCITLARAQQGGQVAFVHTQAGGAVGGEIAFQSFSAIVPGKVVKGAPYSAVANTEMTQELSDGNQISHKMTSTVYRDGQGRTRREESFGGIGLAVIKGHQPHSVVFISDPVSGSDYVLEPENKIARKMPSMPANAVFNTRTFPMGAGVHVSTGPDGPGPGEPGVRFSQSADVGFATKTFQIGPGVPGPEVSDVQTSTEALGQQTIEGVVADGKRTTTTIPAGAIGNQRAITTTTEEWFSSEMQVVVLSTTKDPRMGETTYRLTNIRRQEPPTTLFTLPADYAVKDFDKFPPPLLQLPEPE